MFPHLFYVIFNVNCGVITWTYAAEIFPLSMRVKGNALSAVSLWTGSICLVAFFCVSLRNG